MRIDEARMPTPRAAAFVKTLAAQLAPGRLQTRCRGVWLGFQQAGALFREPITSANALAAVRARLANRGDTFLDAMERAIFAHAGSPYRPLLATAGYDLTKIRAFVARDGVEETLRTLAHDGVYVTVEEYKGDSRSAARRAGLSIYAGRFSQSSGPARHVALLRWDTKPRNRDICDGSQTSLES